MFSRLVAFTALPVLLLVAGACSKEQPAAQPTVTTVVEASPTPGAVAIPPLPTRTPTAGGRLSELPATTLLIDIDGGKVVTLYRDPEYHASPGGWFDKDGRTVWYAAFENQRPVTVRTSLDGTELSREHDADAFLPWNPTPGGCEVDGRLYAGVACGSISPNGRWMVYRASQRDLPVTGRAYDLWAVDLETGERKLLQAGLVACTQCDASGRQEWSASGDYLMVGDTGNTLGLYLINLPAGTSRPMVISGEERIPEWSPIADMLAYSDVREVTVLEDARDGTLRELAELPWPARFDPTGRYLYSVGEDFETTIVDVTSGALVAKLAGIPGYDANEGFRNCGPGSLAVVGHGRDGFVAALGPTPDCEGTQIYVGGRAKHCIANAGTPVHVAGPVKSGDGAQDGQVWAGERAEGRGQRADAYEHPSGRRRQRP